MFMMDAYTREARVLPGILTWVPAWIAGLTLVDWSGFAATLIPQAASTGITGVTLGAAGLVWCAMTAQQTSDRGKTEEPDLWRRWGGKPTTRMLRHGDTTLPASRKEKLHAWIRGQGLVVPTFEDEQGRPEWSDDQWDIAVTKMRTLTKGDPRLDAKNRRYGFYRNLYGGRRRGWTIGVVGLTATTTLAGWTTWDTGDVVNLYSAGTIAIVGWVLVWRRECREAKVKAAAEEYAGQLFDCMIGLS